jgi:phage gp45-like
MTYRSSEDFAQETSAFRRYVYGMIRRFAITLTDAARWQLLGQRGGAGGDEILSDVEAFTGIGFYSRPPSSGGNPEAIGVGVGGTRTTVIVAARDEATRQAVAGDLPPDSAAMFNTRAILVINPDGTVEIRTPSGTAVELALKSDVEAVDNKYANHLHGAAGAPTTGPLSVFTPGAPPVAVPLTPADIVGTTVLKAQ